MIYINTITELINNNININTAKRMIDTYNSKINTNSGCYKIIDINYDFENKCKDITLKCSNCGRIIHRQMVNGKNKWSELIKTCPCDKEKKESEKLAFLEYFSKIKKAEIISRIGNTYGDYVIESVEDLEAKPKYTITCVKCGDSKIVSASIKNPNSKIFHCTKHFMPKIIYDESYIGRSNNHLTVIDIIHDNERRKFKCLCDCGAYAIVEPFHFENGIVKSCGCFANGLKLEHNNELDRLRRIHSGMIQRCYNPNSDAFDNYGGRGISICDDWKNDREKFIKWALENGYSNELSIDRINVNGNYCPENCRWADSYIQNHNKRPKSEWKKPQPRKHKTWTINNITKTREEWCAEYNIGLQTVLTRVNHKNMTIEQALKTPKLTDGRPRKG